jgi:uncharacterized repeat protein (TIGR01451 family)
MRKINSGRKIQAVVCVTLLLFGSTMLLNKPVLAAEYTGEDIALAILHNTSTLIDCSYYDTDSYGNRQSIVLSSLGTMLPTHGNTFALFSTGIAGDVPVTSHGYNPGDERGSWFSGGQYGSPRDRVVFSMTLNVPGYMHYVYYDVQFFSTEYPEYVGSIYNDELTVTVSSPSKGDSYYSFDINSGYFTLDSDGIRNTGFDVYAQSGYPNALDWIDTTPRHPGADAGASDLINIGGISHPVSPYEQITITIELHDDGDNQCDSAAFIDNVKFSGYARTELVARKTVTDLNEGDAEPGDELKYTVTLSNTGTATQHDNPGDEFIDAIPANSTYVENSITATAGSIGYDETENQIEWNGEIAGESSVTLTYNVLANEGLSNGSEILNQGVLYWDSNEDGTNDAIEYTDDPHVDDGIDYDGDGDTDDDDPTIIRIISFTPPNNVTEGFNDDPVKQAATQHYIGKLWFSTTSEHGESNFEVAQSYSYETPQSFKTKMRLSGSPQYWYYNMSTLESFFNEWKINFACGNATERADTILTFLNSFDDELAKIRILYKHQGLNPPLDWVATLSYWSPTQNSWVQLYSDTPGGYLYNDWYTLKLTKIDNQHIRYSLYRNGELVDNREDTSITSFIESRSVGSTAANLAKIKWESTYNPVVCPLLFWDDHQVSLIQS